MVVPIDLENWMSNLPAELKTAPIISLAIPGSHDSMTYTIRKNSPVAPDAEKIVRYLLKYFGWVLRPVVYNWCVTQKSSVSEQLNLGIRYFDLRLGIKDGNDGFYIVHGLCGDEVDGIFKDIKSFLDGHPMEIVILDMQHFYGFNESDHQKYMNTIEGIFYKMLCPKPEYVTNVSLQWMIENHHRVVVIYRNQCAEENSLLWESAKWPTPWPQTMSTEELLNFLDDKVLNHNKKVGFVSQCVLTPTNVTVLRSPFSSLLWKCAVPAHKVIIPWLNKSQQGNLNVVISDFIEIDNDSFPSTVVSLNLKK